MNPSETPKIPFIQKGPLAKIASESAISNETPYTNICTGMGVDNDLPVRIAAYALPTLQFGESFPLAQTEFYIAQAFAIRLNNLNSRDLDINAELIKEYIHLLRLQLAITKVPVWLAEQDPFTPNRTTILHTFAQTLREQGSERLIRFADNRNGDSSLEYIAAHALYMWDKLGVDDQIFITKRESAPQSLLMIGGPAEKLFHEARQILVQHFPDHSQRVTAQAYTEVGRRPPYYKVDEEMLLDRTNTSPIEFEKVLTIPDSDVLRDTLFLLISLTETLKFSDLSRIKKAQINDQEKEDLASACVKLQSVVAQLRS